MEQFISEVEAYASLVGRSPQSILRDSINAKWGAWKSWRQGASSPTLANADRVRAYIVANPPVDAASREGDAA